MQQVPEPTFWEWVGFWITTTLVFYAFGVAILDRLPTWIGDGLRHLLLHRIPSLLVECLRLLSWAFAWLGAGFIWVLSAGRVPVVDELLGRDRRPASVNHSPIDYVTPPAAPPPPTDNDNAVAATMEGLGEVIATRHIERNAPLSRNVVVQAQADIIARLIRSETLYIPDGRGGFKKLGQTALIRLALNLEPNGRPESDYGQLKAALDPLIKPPPPTISGRHAEGQVAK